MTNDFPEFPDASVAYTDLRKLSDEGVIALERILNTAVNELANRGVDWSKERLVSPLSQIKSLHNSIQSLANERMNICPHCGQRMVK